MPSGVSPAALHLAVCLMLGAALLIVIQDVTRHALARARYRSMRRHGNDAVRLATSSTRDLS